MAELNLQAGLKVLHESDIGPDDQRCFEAILRALCGEKTKSSYRSGTTVRIDGKVYMLVIAKLMMHNKSVAAVLVREGGGTWSSIYTLNDEDFAKYPFHIKEHALTRMVGSWDYEIVEAM